MDTRFEQRVRPTYERRIGKRVQPGHLVIEWRPDRRPGLVSRLREEVGRARVVDLSVTGAQVVVANDERVQHGSSVDIGFGQARGLADIRWVAPIAGQPYSRCGIQFWDLDDPLKERLYGYTVEEDHPERVERWERSR